MEWLTNWLAECWLYCLGVDRLIHWLKDLELTVWLWCWVKPFENSNMAITKTYNFNIWIKEGLFFLSLHVDDHQKLFLGPFCPKKTKRTFAIFDQKYAFKKIHHGDHVKSMLFIFYSVGKLVLQQDDYQAFLGLSCPKTNKKEISNFFDQNHWLHLYYIIIKHYFQALSVKQQTNMKFPFF